MANDPIKRLKYFTGQFLEDTDFQAEQDYHTGLRRRGNRALYYRAGILDGGFEVSVKPGDPGRILIAPGIGIDGKGCELILVEPEPLELPLPPQVSPGWNFVTLSYHERETDEQVADQDVSDNTRYEEKPLVEFRANLGEFDNQVEIVIGRIQVNAQRQAVGAVDHAVRQMASARLPGDLTIGSSLHVSGNVGIGTPSTGSALEIRGPNSPIGAAGQRDVSLSFEAAGSTRIRAFRGTSWDTSLQFLTNAATRGRDDPEVRLHIDPDGKIGIGTPSPKARLEVSGGAIMPAAGNSEEAGILFPGDPGGGSGDKAWIRYYARPARSGTTDSAERTALEIGTDNESFATGGGGYQDDILLMPSGGVGIGTRDPAGKLHIAAGDEHGAVISVAGSGKALAITTDANIAYTQGRAMKKVLGGGEFKWTCSTPGLLSQITYSGSAAHANSIGVNVTAASNLGHLSLFTNFNLPLNAVIASVRIRLNTNLPWNGPNWPGRSLWGIIIRKLRRTDAGWAEFAVVPFVSGRLVEPGETIYSLALGSGPASDRTVTNNDENFAVELDCSVGSTGYFLVDWVEINFALFDTLSW